MFRKACTVLGIDARLYLRVEFSEEVQNKRSYPSFSGKLKREFQLKDYLNQLSWVMYPGDFLEYDPLCRQASSIPPWFLFPLSDES